MDYLWNGFKQALQIILSLDREFLAIVFVSLKAASLSTLLASFLGIPFAVLMVQKRFFGRGAILTILHTLMSLPTVVVGLLIYSFLSRRGLLGNFGLLYTVSAMVIGQTILAFPIIAGLTASSLNSMDKRIQPTLLALGADTRQRMSLFIREARVGILAAIIAGFGRVFAEVGVSMMLGGNIKDYTRNITTAIALETSKGEFALALALGMVLLTVALAINIFLTRFQKR